MKRIKVEWFELDGIGTSMGGTKGNTIEEIKESANCVTSQIVSRTGCLNVVTSDANVYD